MMRGHKAAGQDMIEFAVPHSLAFTFFPHWVMDLRKPLRRHKSRLIALNVHDAVMHLTEGSCDLLIAYHHPSQPLQLDPERYEMLSLGQETLAPYAKADADGQPLFRLPAAPRAPRALPQLCAGRLPGAAGRADHSKQSPAPLHARPDLRDRHGRGPEGDGDRRPRLAFLPTSSVRKELARAAPGAGRSAGRLHELTMEVRDLPRAPRAARHTKPGAAGAVGVPGANAAAAPAMVRG